MPDDSLALLLVEDDPGTTASLSRILALNGYRVDTAATIAVTLDRDNWSDYFAIILDRKLPDGMADDILPQLKQLAPDATLIVVTAYTDLNGTITALRHGVADYFIKPVDPEILRANLKHIVERRRATVALRESGQRIRAIVNTAAEAIITFGEDDVIDTFNLAAERMFGYTADEAIGHNFNMLIPFPYRDEHDGDLAPYPETGESRIICTSRELTGRRKDGETFSIELSVSEIGHLQTFTGIIHDISERKALQAELLRIDEEEQRRVGQDLHDNTQQELTGLGLLAYNLAEALADKSLPEAEMAARLSEGLDQCQRNVRMLSKGMIPVEIDAQGLASALTELARRISELHSVTCRFECNKAIELNDNFVATHLYRISQEAVTNALRHSQPDSIQISLNKTDDLVTLRIIDNGIGIDESRDKVSGMGLRIMAYRAGVIGAALHIGAGEQGGTAVTCTLSTAQA